MFSLVPDDAFVRQAKNEHLACWWGGLVGGGIMAGKKQEKGDPPLPSQQCWGVRRSVSIAGAGSQRDQKGREA